MAKSKGPSAVDIGAAVGIIGEVIGALKAIPNAVAGFVGAFNPASVLGMDQAFRDLSATVGAGLEPVVQGATQVIRLIADEFGASFDALRPVVSELAGQFINVLAPVIRFLGNAFANVVEVLHAFMPVFTLLTTVLEGVATAFMVFWNTIHTVVAALYEWIAGLFSLGDVTATVRDSFVYLIGVMIQFADWVLRFLGLGDVADKVLKNLAKDVQGQGKKAAPRDVQLGGLEDVYRKRILEAAKAGQGVDPVVKQTSIMEEVAKIAKQQLDAAKENNNAAKEQREKFDRLFGDVAKVVTTLSDIQTSVGKIVRPVFNVPGAAAGVGGTVVKKLLGFGFGG